MSLLTDRIAVVTGASSGIGRAAALALAAAGARVVVNYRASATAAGEVVRAIETGGGKAVAIQADVSDAAQVDALLAATRAHFGVPVIWANMAGADILTGTGAGLSDHDKLQLLLNVDVRGTVNCSWAVAPVMQEAGGGTIVNMSWDLALRGM
ncbi:MAG: SDR family NAD(P)-dependent oxidoreductase, partial [Gammaproteobacteria bacterium]|nr:SDR family NAD(P)-dependent oxidoreductase [Gammaproteobacteria bacterium]